MSVGLPVLAVLALAGFSIAAAVLTTIAAERPERAAMVVVLAGAGGGVAFVVLTMVGLGIGGVEQAMETSSMRRAGSVALDPVRVVSGLGVAGALLAVAVWLVRTGDWARVDREDEGEEGAA